MTSLRDGLVAEYLFSGGVRDTSGFERHGENHGATFGRDRFGAEGAACYFDGHNNHIAVAPPPLLNATAMSVSVWVLFEEGAAEEWSNCIISQDDGNDADQSRRVFQLSCNNQRIAWHLMERARDPIYRRPPRVGEWYHVTAVVSQGVHQLFVDGVLQDEECAEFATHAEQPLHIGRKGTDEPYFFLHGAVDDVRMYNRALSADEILALFHEGGYSKAPIPPLAAGPETMAGEWGMLDTVLLDLAATTSGSVTGRVMDGIPGRWAAVESGTFDASNGFMELRGHGQRPDGSGLLEYRIIGTLDSDQLTVTYTFGYASGNLILRPMPSVG